ELRKLSWSGIPKPVRAVTWKLLSGYLPANVDRRPATLQRKQKEYFAFIDHYYDSRNDEVHQDTYRQIHIDIPRMNPEALILQPKVTEIFERILFIWAIRHPASGYVQGINDLVTPFFVVFICEYIDDEDADAADISRVPEDALRNVEADTYWCMSRLLDGIQDNYTFAQPGIQMKVKMLEELVSRIDEQVHRHLDQHEVRYLQFAFRWMNNLLMRELPLRCAVRLWDTYQSEPEGFANFHLYVCAAFLVRWRKEILEERDFQELLLFLQNLPTTHWGDEDVSLLLAEAYRLKFAFADAPNHYKKRDPPPLIWPWSFQHLLGADTGSRDTESRAHRSCSWDPGHAHASHPPAPGTPAACPPVSVKQGSMSPGFSGLLLYPVLRAPRVCLLPPHRGACRAALPCLSSSRAPSLARRRSPQGRQGSARSHSARVAVLKASDPRTCFIDKLRLSNTRHAPAVAPHAAGFGGWPMSPWAPPSTRLVACDPCDMGVRRARPFAHPDGVSPVPLSRAVLSTPGVRPARRPGRPGEGRRRSSVCSRFGGGAQHPRPAQLGKAHGGAAVSGPGLGRLGGGALSSLLCLPDPHRVRPPGPAPTPSPPEQCPSLPPKATHADAQGLTLEGTCGLSPAGGPQGGWGRRWSPAPMWEPLLGRRGQPCGVRSSRTVTGREEAPRGAQP
ncbi:unnamed protein product, partial [Rangifer tarandus platyrhynchus]